MLRTHSPLRPSIATRSAFDLHVLSTPPAFILSQDQTLRRELLSTPSRRTGESYRSRRSTTPVVARRKSPLSQGRSGGPLKLTSGVFPITSQLLRCRRLFQTAVPSAGAQSFRRQSGRDNTTLPLACQETEKPMHALLASVGADLALRAFLRKPEAVSASFGLSFLVSPALRRLNV